MAQEYVRSVHLNIINELYFGYRKKSVILDIFLIKPISILYIYVVIISFISYYVPLPKLLFSSIEYIYSNSSKYYRVLLLYDECQETP